MNDHHDFLDLASDKARTPEEELWLAALILLINDANMYLNKSQFKDHHKEAFDDLVRCGPFTKHLSHFNDIDPEWLSNQYKLSVRKHYRVAA